MYINVIDSVSMAVYVYQSEIQAARRGASHTATGLTQATEISPWPRLSRVLSHAGRWLQRSRCRSSPRFPPLRLLPRPRISLPLNPVPAPDPIFAAIEAHERAYAGLNAFLGELAAVEQAAWHAPRGQRRAANKRLAQSYATERRFGDIESDAFARLVATVPQTLHGAAAMLAYVRAHCEQGCPICEEDETIALLGSIACTICRAAGLPMPPR
jgi:hypothetical protein